MLVTEYIYKKFKDKDEGFLTKLRSKIICGKTCIEFTKKLGLKNFILADSAIVINDHILEDIFEAFVGALYEDLGLEITRNFVIKLVSEMDFEKMNAKNTNYKDVLMKYTHANNYELPIYTLELKGQEKEGEKEGKHFFISSLSLKKCTSIISGVSQESKAVLISKGKGYTIQESEQEACRKSICHYSTSNQDILEHYKKCKLIHLKDIKHMLYTGKAYKTNQKFLDANN